MNPLTATLLAVEGITDLDAAVSDALGDEPTVDDAVNLYLSVGAAKKTLATVEALVSDFLVDVVGSQTTTSRGDLVEVKRFKRGSKCVDGEGLLARIIAQATDERRVDEATGEYEREADAVARVLAEVAPLTTPSFAWRLRELRARGFDLEDWFAGGEWTARVQVIPVKKGAA